MNATNKLLKFNIYFIITFFITIFLLLYFLSQNISYLDKRAKEDKFTTKINATQIIFEQVEYRLKSNLDKFKNSSTLTKLIKKGKIDEATNFILEDLDSMIDMACIYTKDKVDLIKNNSTYEVFDTIQKNKKKYKKGFFKINVKNKTYYMMISNIKIIDPHLGKVISTLCFSIVLNNNNLLLQEIKDRLDINEVFLTSGYDFIAGTRDLDDELKRKILLLKNGDFIKYDNLNVSKYKIDETKQFSITMFLSNADVLLLKENIIVLFIVIITILLIVFVILYILLKKYIKKFIEQEEIMIAQSRHAAMSEMISMIAHQWRQPLSIIAMDANNIIADVELDMVDNSTLKKGSLNILEQTQELSKTISDFKNFFKPIKNITNIYLEDIFKDTLNVVGKSLQNNNIEVIKEFKNHKKIKTYSRELMQVFINIIKNAKEALVENDIKDKKIYITIKDTKNLVEINISDNAGGIKPDIINKVFNPYFSTKSEKNGTGLGLYISKTIIEKHLNGTITVKNIKDRTCFKIKLPYDLSNSLNKNYMLPLS
ncbi:MAG: HAMP domain-containing sensor histidine kinase [Campylobacterota bacterium]|nr:HAMP domain-containing sensor histidine kinase [Campylobacterota bacterium]